jgi:hypothetical protein
MRFLCNEQTKSPGICVSFDTFKVFRAWACRAFQLCSGADALEADVAYYDDIPGNKCWRRLSARECPLPFVLAPEYAIICKGKQPVSLVLV